MPGTELGSAGRCGLAVFHFRRDPLDMRDKVFLGDGPEGNIGMHSQDCHSAETSPNQQPLLLSDARRPPSRSPQNGSNGLRDELAVTYRKIESLTPFANNARVHSRSQIRKLRQDAIPSLVRAVTQARTWSEWIVDGKVMTMRELAAKAGLNRHYTSRILRLAALSPQLVDAILKGKHSPVLTLVGVTDDLPRDWKSQYLARS